jgi:hypothetical protein
MEWLTNVDRYQTVSRLSFYTHEAGRKPWRCPSALRLLAKPKGKQYDETCVKLVEKLPTTYPLKALRGQKGLQATAPIVKKKKHTRTHGLFGLATLSTDT